jgi:hypothetical protein
MLLVLCWGAAVCAEVSDLQACLDNIEWMQQQHRRGASYATRDHVLPALPLRVLLLGWSLLLLLVCIVLLLLLLLLPASHAVSRVTRDSLACLISRRLGLSSKRDKLCQAGNMGAAAAGTQAEGIASVCGTAAAAVVHALAKAVHAMQGGKMER